MDKDKTIQKLLVLGTIQSMKIHPTAEEIFKHLELRFPQTSRTTVNRHLKQLLENGEIRRIEVPGAADRFDVNAIQNYHLVCTICGKISDVPIPYMSDLDKVIGEMTDYDMESHSIVFRGICPGCRIKN